MTANAAATAAAPRKIRIRSPDGAESDATVFAGDEPPSAVVVCTPAIGVAAAYYEGLAAELARRGACVVTAELRGVGSSSVRARRGVDFGYRELLELDLPAVIAAARALYPAARLVLLGHSIGAHLSAIHAGQAATDLGGLVFVASGTSYYRAWRFPGNVSMLGVAALTRGVSALVGFFPGRLFGFFGTQARRLMREWSTLTTTGRFEIAGGPPDAERLLASVALPVLALSFEGDNFAPEGAVRHFLAKMPGARITYRRLRAADIGARSVDHFRWAKYPAPVAEIISRWLASLT